MATVTMWLVVQTIDLNMPDPPDVVTDLVELSAELRSPSN